MTQRERSYQLTLTPTNSIHKPTGKKQLSKDSGWFDNFRVFLAVQAEDCRKLAFYGSRRQRALPHLALYLYLRIVNIRPLLGMPDKRMPVNLQSSSNALLIKSICHCKVVAAISLNHKIILQLILESNPGAFPYRSTEVSGNRSCNISTHCHADWKAGFAFQGSRCVNGYNRINWRNFS